MQMESGDSEGWREVRAHEPVRVVPKKEAAITILCVCTRARLVCTRRLGTVALRPPFDCERLSEQTLL